MRSSIEMAICINHSNIHFIKMLAGAVKYRVVVKFIIFLYLVERLKKRL